MNKIGIFDEIFDSRRAQPDGKQFWNSMIFAVVVVGPMPDQFDLEGYFSIATVCFSGIETFFESEISFSRCCGWKSLQTMQPLMVLV